MAINNALNTGTIPLAVSSGGTGLATLTNHALQLGAGTSTPTQLVLAAGQIAIGTTASDPAAASLTPGSGISISSVTGSITISATGGNPWTVVSGTSVSLAVNTNYILNNAGLVTATLPATFAVGDIIRIQGQGAGGWLIAQNSGQVINLGASPTTSGATGSLASTNRYDSIELLAITANTTLVVFGAPQGNITVV